MTHAQNPTALVFFLLLAAVTSARADETESFVALGVGATPEYEGSGTQQVIPFLAARVNFDDRYVAFDGITARANLSPFKGVEFGPVAGYRFGRNSDVVSAFVALLPQVDDAFEAGAFAAIFSGPLFARGDTVRVSVDVLHDVSGTHKSWVVTPALGYASMLTDCLRMKAEISASFAGGEYADTYFSISAPSAAASGLGAFSAGGGLKGLGASFQWTYAVSRKWSVVGYSSYNRIAGDAADSPIVADAGDEDQFTVGLGVGRVF
jgi:outer membrane scaffolding protein for murein synthesis (MipA/OmpV family)